MLLITAVIRRLKDDTASPNIFSKFHNWTLLIFEQEPVNQITMTTETFTHLGAGPSDQCF